MYNPLLYLSRYFLPMLYRDIYTIFDPDLCT